MYSFQEITEAKTYMELLMKDQERLDRDLAETNSTNQQLEERVAELIQETRVTERTKHWVSIISICLMAVNLA